MPNYHRQGSATEDKNFVSWLRDLEARGYEIVIHGYFHERPRRVGERIKEKFMTRFYTQDEGEFSISITAKPSRELRERVMNLKLRAYHRLDLSPRPGCSITRANARRATPECTYTTRIDSVLDLLTGEREATRSLVYSTHSKWRRTVSLGWNAALSRSLEMRELARLSIHPPDFEAPKIWGQILQFIQRFARTRNATTYRDWIGRQRTNRKAT